MAIRHSKYVSGPLRIPHAEKAGEVIAIRYEHDYVEDGQADGDILELGVLPANMTVRDMVVDADDVDGSTDFEFDIGLMNGDVGEQYSTGTTPRTCGAEFFSGGTIGRTSGIARMTEKTGFRVAPVDYHRSIGVKFVDQGTTTGKFGVTVFYGAA